MKIVIVNGSPRKGNTLAAISAFAEGASPRHEVEIIEANKLNMKPCQGCEACECYKGCVAKDDTNATVDKLVQADMIVFATPVYWWGMTAQLKLVIDKCYCKGAQLKNKGIGVIMVGGADVDSPQYGLIRSQFACMAQFLNWDALFYRAYSATAKDDLAQQADAIEELKAMGAAL